ncbi:MAG: restriction endonuclease [Sedimentisphaerales bacterium]|nr:restriction endonuclease [Sedimentisphaerales bacterium]
MAIPDYETLMLPVLKLAGDGKEHSLREATEHIIESFNLTEDEQKTLLPSGTQRVIVNRVGWAITYLKKCKLLESTKRGYFKNSPRGSEVLNQNLTKIDSHFLQQFPEYHEFKVKKQKPKEKSKIIPETNRSQTPEELLAEVHEELNQNLVEELLSIIKESSPSFFEMLVIDLLVKMGYGGSRKDAGQAVGGIGDEGIDGIIKEDKLGLDAIYIQAKKWENNISRPDVQKFAGALQGKRAKKGIFITTSAFSREAKEYASNIESKIILIDGEKLAELMIEHNVGISTVNSYEVKKIDLDYFSE